MKFFVPENQVSWCAFPFLALLVRQPTGRILTSAPLKSFWPRRRLQWRSSGLDWRTCWYWFWYLSWSWYLYQKLSWQSFESDIQGKCTDIESICCSTGLRSRGNSKHPWSLWSGRRPGWHGRVWVASVYNLQDSRMFIWIELMISLLTMHTGPRCPKRWPSATSRKSFCQHDEWWAMLMQCIGTEQGCWYCWHHYFVLSLLTSSREPKRKTFHSSGLCGSPREFLCPSSRFQLRPSCRWVLFVSNQPGWVKRDHEKLRSKSILIFLEASPPHLHLHFSAPPLLP